MAWPADQVNRPKIKRDTAPSVWNMFKAQQRAASKTTPYFPVDPKTDLVWANASGDRPDSSYFDYFYSGSDVRIILDGAEEFGSCEIPVLAFGYNIEQKKQPFYGFWSYTYDALARGTRIVSGQFVIPTTYPNRMSDLIAKSAEQRSNQAQAVSRIRQLNIDEQNIETYWAKTRDPMRKGNYGQRHIFSIHPPFNFVVTYGIQSTSVSENPALQATATYARYQSDFALFQNVNERLVDGNPDSGLGKSIIEMVELTSLQVAHQPDGQVCAEAYTFLARDVVNPGV